MIEKTLKNLKETKEERNMLKNKNGITLIALVVTIVVLLLLAGVSISLILDNNGIIQKSKDAKREYAQARENEQADLNNAGSWIDAVINEPDKVEPENIGDWEYTEEDDGTITITSYKGTDTTVIIPNYINNKPVKKITGNSSNTLWNSSICNAGSNNDGAGMYTKKQDTIEKVIISEGIEIIGEFTFTSTLKLKQIIIPDTITEIGYNAFAYCVELPNVIIPNKVTTIENYTFFGCEKLSNVIIPNSITTIETYAFYGCESLHNIDIPSNVTSMGRAVFNGISSITVNVPFKEGETPNGWNENWDKPSTSLGKTPTVNYKQ